MDLDEILYCIGNPYYRLLGKFNFYVPAIYNPYLHEAQIEHHNISQKQLTLKKKDLTQI